MYQIDEERFTQRVWQMIALVQSEQERKGCKNPDSVSFTHGWFYAQEYYKHQLWVDAQAILYQPAWTEADIGTGKLREKVLQCMSLPMENGPKNNLLDWHTDALDEKLARHPVEAEQVFYQIYYGSNDESAFAKAVEVFGGERPFLSLLFFLKKKTPLGEYRYLPLRPQIMQARLEMLGVKTDCLSGRFTWENYQEYIALLRDIQKKLRRQLDAKATLLDAHSFVWSLWALNPKEENTPVPNQGNLALVEEVEQIEKGSSFYGADKEAMVKVRVNASRFRSKMLKYADKCKLCGLSNRNLLIVSHIKPWAVSNCAEKVDPNNAFLLCPNHDKLFDQGFISFTDDGKLLVSDQLTLHDRNMTNLQEGQKIQTNEENKTFLQYHREHIFKGKTKVGVVK